MKHLTIKSVSTERHTPTDAYPNRARSQQNQDGEARFARRETRRRFVFPAGKARGRFIGKIYPNGEFTLGYKAIEKKRVDDSRYERGEVGGYIGTSPEPDEVDTTLGSIPVPHDERVYSLPKLGSASESSQEFRKYGLHGLTPYGKRMVKNVGYMMEKEFGKAALSMGTLTIPQFSEMVMREICANWAYLVRAFFQEMKRIYDREGLEFRYCSVSEIQPKRWALHRQVGLHIHFLWVPVWVDWADRWLVSYDDIRRIWRRLLQNIVNRCFDASATVPLVPVPNFRDERVKHDACAYMAKYMSKGCEIIQEVVSEKGEDCVPSQWWSADEASKNIVKGAIIHAKGEVAAALVDICEGNHDSLVVYKHAIAIERSHRPDLVVGYVGRLSVLGMSAVAYLHYPGAIS